MEFQLFKTLKKAVNYWYIPLIVGLLLLATGIWTFVNPDQSYLALALTFSMTFLIVGFVEIFFSISNRDDLDNWGWMLLFGILTSLVGVMLLSMPQVSQVSLPIFVGFLVMFRSFMAMGIAMDLKDYGVLDWGNLMVLGVLGLIFSFILLWNPGFAGMTIIFWTGLALIVLGIFSIYMSYKFKNLHSNWDKLSSELKTKYNDISAKVQKAMKNNGVEVDIEG